ncbi:MAG: hypothetical protein RLZZ117_2634 [Cyanobacteriota bacterium]
MRNAIYQHTSQISRIVTVEQAAINAISDQLCHATDICRNNRNTSELCFLYGKRRVFIPDTRNYDGIETRKDLTKIIVVVATMKDHTFHGISGEAFEMGLRNGSVKAAAMQM